MKNTMKIKSLLSFFVPAALMALSVASCSDYDNGYNEQAIKFQEEFRKAYGDIDPEQDWNLAERASVTVSTMQESRVKIYALRGNEYVIVGDYEGVKGTQQLNFDMVEGTTQIMVTDGKTAEQTVPGGVVTFGSTRTVYGGNGTVTIEKITDPNGLTLDENGVTYPMYKEATEADYEAMKAVIPEIGYRQDHTNLNKVTHDFSYVSNGTFIIYPYYWETSSQNTIGIYYNDASGNRQEVDLYKIKEGDEFQYKGKGGSTYTQAANFSNTEGSNATSNAGYWPEYKAFVWTAGSYNLLRNIQNMPTGDLLNNFTDLTVSVTFKKKTPGLRIVFYKSDGTNKWIEIANPNPTDDGTEKVEQTISLQSIVNQHPELEDYLRNCSEVCIAGSQNVNNGTFKSAIGTDVYGDVELNTLQFERRGDGSWQNYSENFCSEIYTNNIGTMVRGQGIKVNLPKGTTFGMYLKKTDSSGSYTFYSQGELNEPGTVGCGVTDNGAGTVTDVEGMRPCYASTFHVGEQMFLGFEDWPNIAHMSDFDLNDVVFAFDGCKPTIINEDPTPGGTWLLVCEDLGGSFDTDYNDVVFKVEHISGQEFANVTAMAAGGTLASYIFFRDPTTAYADDQIVGEIHQMFNVAPEASGAYTPINAYSRFEANGNTVMIKVGKDWTMAYYEADKWHQSNVGNYENVNMGGFQIRTLKSGTEAPSANAKPTDDVFNNSARSSVIAAPDKGAAPYMLCLPYSYTVTEGNKINEYVWAWPQELCTICSATYTNGTYSGSNGGQYLEFGGWVSKYQDNVDWYKHPNGSNALIVEHLLLSSKDVQQQQGSGNEKKPSPLRSKGRMSIIKGEGCSLSNNILSESNGALTFYLGYNGGKWNIDTSFGEGNNRYNFVPSSAGLHTIIVEQAETDEYEGGTTSFILMVNQAYTFTVTGSDNQTYWLANVDGQVKLGYNTNQPTKWVLEPSGDGDYFYMYNVGSKKYLSMADGDNGNFSLVFVDSPVGNWTKFLLVDDKIARYGGTRFLGVHDFAAQAVVDGYGAAPKGSTSVTWTQTAVNKDN